MENKYNSYKKCNIRFCRGLGIGDWGLGIGPNPQSPIPNPQSPIHITQSFEIYKWNLIKIKKSKQIFIFNLFKHTNLYFNFKLTNPLQLFDKNFQNLTVHQYP